MLTAINNRKSALKISLSCTKLSGLQIWAGTDNPNNPYDIVPISFDCGSSYILESGRAAGVVVYSKTY